MKPADCRKVVLYIAASLDGCIATRDHNLDWLFAVEGEGDNGYAEFYATVDTILMGRVTYDWIVEHMGGPFPYRGRECYVFTRTPRESNEDVTFIHTDPLLFTRELKQRPGKNIWLEGGGELLDAFIKGKLVDEVIVTIAPILLGSGIPLFRENAFQTALRLKSLRRFNQFAELHYEVVR